MGGVGTRWNYLRRSEVIGFVIFSVVLAVFGAVWLRQAFLAIDDNSENVCASLAILAADRRSPAMTPGEASSRAQYIFEQAELGRDRRLAGAVGDYGRALASGDPARVQQAEAAFERMCDASRDR